MPTLEGLSVGLLHLEIQAAIGDRDPQSVAD
jgi:hypothetical protein